MSQIGPESLHIAPLDDLPDGVTEESVVASDYVRIERTQELGTHIEGRSGTVVIECPPELVAPLAADGWLVAVCPDDLGAEPGGPLEAVVTKSMVDGARVIRSKHQTEVRRCMHITAALIIEREGAPL
ncbi:MAG: hypothetical protein ACR2OH_12135 [Microthrixaceae bacterium]